MAGHSGVGVHPEVGRRANGRGGSDRLPPRRIGGQPFECEHFRERGVCVRLGPSAVGLGLAVQRNSERPLLDSWGRFRPFRTLKPSRTSRQIRSARGAKIIKGLSFGRPFSSSRLRRHACATAATRSRPSPACALPSPCCRPSRGAPRDAGLKPSQSVSRACRERKALTSAERLGKDAEAILPCPTLRRPDTRPC